MNIQGWFFFRIDWFGLLAVQGTLKSLLQHHSLKASILQPSVLFQRRQWHPTPVLLPGKSYGWTGSLPWVAKSRTWLSDFIFIFYFHALEKEMATHSSVLAWRVPGTGEPGGLPSVGSHRVGHDWSDLAAAAALFMVQLSHLYMTTGKTIA